MKRIFISLSICACALTLNAQQDVMVCNFDDDVSNVSAWGTMTFATAPAPADVLASGTMGVLTVVAGNQAGSLVIQMDNTFNPQDYVGISLDAQVTTAGLNPAFILKLDQSSDPGNLNQIQDWTYNVRYSGSGDWEKIQLPFSDAILPALDDKIAADESFPADQYDKIELAPGAWDNQPAFTMNVDDIMLHTSWDMTGIPLIKVASLIITSIDGTVSAKAENGSQTVLKVYSISGQEIAEGVNQVHIGTKGIYIVKATAENASMVSKIIVK